MQNFLSLQTVERSESRSVTSREVRQIVGVKRERRRRKQSGRGQEGGVKVKGRDQPRGAKDEELVWSEINMTNG